MKETVGAMAWRKFHIVRLTNTLKETLNQLLSSEAIKLDKDTIGRNDVIEVGRTVASEVSCRSKNRWCLEEH